MQSPIIIVTKNALKFKKGFQKPNISNLEKSIWKHKIIKYLSEKNILKNMPNSKLYAH